MSSNDEQAAKELLLRLGEFGSFVSKRLVEVAGDDLMVQNISVMLLCRLDLDGPLRPNQLAELQDMTTGGVSKLIDRMESDGLVERRHGVLATDQRAVLVVLTRKGRDLVHQMAEVIADQLTETQAIVKELNRLLEPLSEQSGA